MKIEKILSAAALACAVTLGATSCENCNKGGECKTCSGEESCCAEGKEGECCHKGAGKCGAVAVLNLDRVLTEYMMSVDEQGRFEKKAKSVEDEILRRRSKVEADYKAFQEKIDKGLLTRSTAEVQGQKLQKAQDDFNAYAQQKQSELAEEQQVTVNNIADAVKKHVDAYAAEKGYSLVFTTQGNVLPAPVAFCSPELDITEDFIASINAAYSAAEAQK